MKRARRFISLALLASMSFSIVSCSDQPVAPDVTMAAPQADLIGGLLDTTTELLKTVGLLKCKATYAQTTQTVGRLGGVITVGPHSLAIPYGALDENVTITATNVAGNVNLVEFQPAGLVFKKDAALTMSYANCNLLGSLAPKRIAYIDDSLNILEYLLSLDNLLRKKVTGRLKHFSGYAVAW
jgi:hypothetical protein